MNSYPPVSYTHLDVYKRQPEGVPLVIMITKDLGKITEINALAEMEVSGHYRYPYPCLLYTSYERPVCAYILHREPAALEELFF